MATQGPEITTGDPFCGNCGSAVIPGAAACENCGAAIQHEHGPVEELISSYIPYCRACGVPVPDDVALHCTKCGVTPLCLEHFYPSTRSCSLCPPEVTAEAREKLSSKMTRSASGPWAQPATTFPCGQCGARLRRGVGYCPNCGAEYAGANADSSYVGFFPRLGAAIIDAAVPILITTLINVMFVSFPGIFVLLFVSYHAGFTHKLGQTPGKMAMGIQIVGSDHEKPTLRQIILREVIGKLIVFLAMFIGFIWVIWDPQRRGWHDYIGNTYVVRKDQQ